MAGLRFEGIETALTPGLFPTVERGHADTAFDTQGKIVDCGRNVLSHLMALSPARFAHDGQDQRVARQRNFGPTIVGIKLFTH